MAQRRSLAWTELRVGILVTTSFVLLALAIFYISGSSNIWGKKYTILAYFASANGLRSGAEVWLEGVTIGNVTEVRLSTQADPTKAVEVEMKLDQEYQNIIRTDSEVSIGTVGLLGDKIIEITKGTAGGQMVQNGGTLQGEEAGDIKKIITGTNDFIANLDVLGDTVLKLAGKVDRGEGTLGKLISDTAIYDNLNNTAKEAHGLVKDMRTGDGTIGKLMHDDELYQKVNSTVDRVNKMVDTIESGEGTMGKLYKDPSLYNRADNLVARFQSIAEGLDQGKGSLGKFVKDDAFYNDTRQLFARINGVIDAVQNGDGTAGKLIKDPTLYNSLNQTSSEILKLLYDFRQNPKKFLTINFKLF